MLKAEPYQETKLPYIEVNRNFELKYLKNCTWKTAEILTAASTFLSTVNTILWPFLHHVNKLTSPSQHISANTIKHALFQVTATGLEPTTHLVHKRTLNHETF